MKKKILFSILILGLIGASIGFYLYTKPPRDISSTKEDFVLNVEEFYKEFMTNEASANTKYLNKVIIVEGIVTEIQLENSEEPTLSISSQNGDSKLTCGFNKNLTSTITSLKSGNKVTLKGKCDGKNMFDEIVFTQCSFLAK